MKYIYILLSFGLLNALSLHAQQFDKEFDSLHRMRPMHHMLISNGEVTISGKTKGYVTKQEVINAGGPQLREMYATNYHVGQFQLEVVPKQKKAKRKSFESYDGKLTPDMRHAIEQAANGDKLYFERIVSFDKKNSFYDCHPITFELKELPADSSVAKSGSNETPGKSIGQTH